MIPTILVDDEPDAIMVLKSLLEANFKDIKVIATFNNPKEALKKIPQLKPQLLFLDIEMPGINGLEVLEIVQEMKLHTVFFTAHEKYALGAIKLNAFDYLLKPIDPDELETTVVKIRRKIAEKQKPDYGNLLDNLGNHQMIKVPTGKGWRLIPHKEIIYIKAEGNYAHIHLQDDHTLVVIKILKAFEEELSPFGFLRAHNSYLVNPHHIKEYLKAYGGSLLMCNGAEIPISKKFKEVFRKVV